MPVHQQIVPHGSDEVTAYDLDSIALAMVIRDAELVERYRRGDLVFDVIDAGPEDGPVVILLHGFPQLNTSWEPVIARLTARGYRVCLRTSAAN